MLEYFYVNDNDRLHRQQREVTLISHEEPVDVSVRDSLKILQRSDTPSAQNGLVPVTNIDAIRPN